MIDFDLELTSEQARELTASDPKQWFTAVRFSNARSPTHPEARRLEENNDFKKKFVDDWLRRVVPGRSVLDTFCANGGFSFYCQQLGAASVVGVDFEPGRIECARMISSFVSGVGKSCEMRFESQDIYRVAERFQEPFDVVLALGGLYHVADPAHVLRQLRSLTGEWLVVQTSSVLPGRGNRAQFRVRSDRTAAGLSSIRGGSGAWRLSRECLRELLRHGGFEIVEERVPEWPTRKCFPWYGALARPV